METSTSFNPQKRTVSTESICENTVHEFFFKAASARHLIEAVGYESEQKTAAKGCKEPNPPRDPHLVFISLHLVEN